MLLGAATYIHTGKGTRPKPNADTISLKMLCNLYIDHQQSQATAGEVKWRHVYDQTLILRNFVKFAGSNQLVSQVSTINIQNYRQKLLRERNTSNTINNHISTIKDMYNWALDNEMIDTAPNLKAVKKLSLNKSGRPTFTRPQIQELLGHASDETRPFRGTDLQGVPGIQVCIVVK